MAVHRRCNTCGSPIRWAWKPSSMAVQAGIFALMVAGIALSWTLIGAVIGVPLFVFGVVWTLGNAMVLRCRQCGATVAREGGISGIGWGAIAASVLVGLGLMSLYSGDADGSTPTPRAEVAVETPPPPPPLPPAPVEAAPEPNPSVPPPFPELSEDDDIETVQEKLGSRGNRRAAAGDREQYEFVWQGRTVLVTFIGGYYVEHR